MRVRVDMASSIRQQVPNRIVQICRRRSWQVLTIIGVVVAVIIASGSVAIPGQGEQELSVRQTQGQVTLLRSQGSSPATTGARLTRVGEGLRTGRRSSAVLHVHAGLGILNVSEQTELRIQSLNRARDGGRITRLRVPQGQVRIQQTRRFTHGTSTLELETPSGISGIRGTEFGITVQSDDGKTGTATLSGSVATTAHGTTVIVPGGFQNLMVSGEPPTQPVPLRDDPGLDFTRELIIENNTRLVRLVGRVDPVNTVVVDGIPQSVDSEGVFHLTRVAISRLRVQVVVTTPLGLQQVHTISLL